MPFQSITDIVRKIAGKLRLPKGYATVMTYKDGSLNVEGDAIRSRTVSDIQDVLRSSAGEGGSIRIRQDGRVVFVGIEDHLHQRIRNLLLNP